MEPRKDSGKYFEKMYPLTFVSDNVNGDKNLSERYTRAWKLARKAADLLKKSYGASKVVVFGSLVHDAWFTSWSDIDLAAWGIPDDRFYSAVAAVTGMSEEFKIDLIDAETCGTSLRKSIEKEGVEL